MTVNNEKQNSKDICLDFVQEFSLRRSWRVLGIFFSFLICTVLYVLHLTQIPWMVWRTATHFSLSYIVYPPPPPILLNGLSLLFYVLKEQKTGIYTKIVNSER